MSADLKVTIMGEFFSVFQNNSELLLVACILIAFFTYYVCGVAKQPLIVCQNGKFKSFLLDNCPILHDRYWPTFWCFGTHAQTALANILRGRLPDLHYQREILEMKDGGIVALDWLENYNQEHQDYLPTVIFLPGLTGHSQTEYVKSLVPIANKLGCRAVVFNNRGRGGVDIITPRTYSACNTEDLREVLNHIKAKHPGSPIYAVGISLGGIILSHYLSVSGSNSLVSAVMLISVAFDIHASETSLSIPGLNLMLNKHLAQRLCEMVKPHMHKFQEINMDMDFVLESKTIREFDERFTAKIFNYVSVDDYYTAATLRNKLINIKVPLVCVNAADDMFCPASSIPYEEVLSTSNIALVISSRGGHIGFMDGFLPATPFFSERFFEQYLKGILSLDINEKNRNVFIVKNTMYTNLF